MPRYGRFGKIQTPMETDTFLQRMGAYPFPQTRKGLMQIAFITLLYYTGARIGEIIKLSPKQITKANHLLIIDIGKREKGSLTTPALSIPLEKPYVHQVVRLLIRCGKFERLFPFTRGTGYNYVVKVFGCYPHFFRLNRVTSLFLQGWTIAQVRSWTGLSLMALEAYVGLVDVKRMGESLK